MAADDPVDDEALIFTEYEVFAIAGYLAEMWSKKLPKRNRRRTEDIEHAITAVLSSKECV